MEVVLPTYKRGTLFRKMDTVSNFQWSQQNGSEERFFYIIELDIEGEPFIWEVLLI